MLSNYATALVAFLALAAPALAENKLAARANGALGDACRYNSQCREYPTGARPSCDTTGHCNFVCLNAPILMKNAAGTGCVPNGSLPQQCTYASDCSGKTRLPANAVDVCLYNQCTYQCGDGYHKIAGKCYRNQNTCGGTRCATVTNGDTFCGANNQCVYRCDQAEGYTLYANAAKTAYRCFNTGTDVNNCGAIGRSCGNPYGGVGLSVCVSGTCSVTCPAGDVIKTTSTGQYYCASQ